MLWGKMSRGFYQAREGDDFEESCQGLEIQEAWQRFSAEARGHDVLRAANLHIQGVVDGDEAVQRGRGPRSGCLRERIQGDIEGWINSCSEADRARFQPRRAGVPGRGFYH